MKKTMKFGPLVCAVVLASTAHSVAASSRFDSDADSEINRSPNGLLRGVLDEAPTLIKDPDDNFSAEKYRGSEFAQHTKKILKPINDEVLRNDLYQEYIEIIRNDSGLYDATKQGLMDDAEFQEYLAALDSDNTLGCAYESTEAISAVADDLKRTVDHIKNLTENGNTLQACISALAEHARQSYKTHSITVTEIHSPRNGSASLVWTEATSTSDGWRRPKGGLPGQSKDNNPTSVTCEGIVTGVKKEPDVSI